MLKIAMFNMKDEEVPYAKAWAEDKKVDVETHSEGLSYRHLEALEGFDGVIIQQVEPLDEELYAGLSELGVKQIGLRSAGYDMINLRLLKKYGLTLTNVPSYSPESIAEFAVTIALELIRKTQVIHDHVERQDFRVLQPMQGRVLGEMKVAIIGTGHIGQATARIFHGFGCQVKAYDLHEVPSDFYTYASSLEEAVRDADLVSLHLPLNAGTEHLFDRSMLEQLKPGSYFINVSRGGLLDTSALLDLLDEGQLAGAGLDVYEHEAPYVHTNWQGQTIEDPLFRRLLENDRVLFTPHIAYYTDTSIKHLVTMSLDATLDVLEKGQSELEVR